MISKCFTIRRYVEARHDPGGNCFGGALKAAMQRVEAVAMEEARWFGRSEAAPTQAVAFPRPTVRHTANQYARVLGLKR